MDLQKILSQQTGEDPEVHHLTFKGLRLRNMTQTLRQVGLTHSSVLQLTILKCLVVITPQEDAELRFHNIDTAVCQCGQLRAAIMTRLANDKAVLLHCSGRVIPPASYHMTLSSQGIKQGTIISVTYGTAEVPRSPITGPTKTPLQPGKPRPKPLNWPRGTIRIFILAEGIAATKEDAGLYPAKSEVSKLPLPPIRPTTLLTDVRYLVYDLLGVAPRAQLLFNNGTPLPQYGTQQEVRTTVRQIAYDEDCLTLAVDGSHKETNYVKELLPSSRVPWCIHCITHDALGIAEWEPHFVQPSWDVADLLSVITSQAKGRHDFCSLYFRGEEVKPSLTIEGAGLNEGAVVMVLLHETLDLNVDVVLGDGRVLETMIRGVPPESLVSEVIMRSLHATKTPAGGHHASYNGLRLPPTASISSCGIPHRGTLTLSHLQTFRTATPPASPKSVKFAHSLPRAPSVPPSMPESVTPEPRGRVRWPPITNP
eukprot:TRINITY_DN27380_c0_g1_i1.p1 TRINITY_DN27380_c0_g1~~TRINITY_DN27380_c0_g1_i1.p1  ORF type:complete len:530 (+),score=78.68 TRINITY_DN27380_c0_g1_i1:148-1590(+)